MHEQLKVYEEKMQKTMKSLDSDLAAIRAGRANPHILDRLTEYRLRSSRWQMFLFRKPG